MDVTETRYANFDKVLHYCRYSANPVGHLVLQLSNAGTPENVSYSDSICTALQLVNFLQDIEQDYRENGRIYLPQDEMADCRVSESDIAECRNTPALKRLIDIQIHRARRMLEFGRPLGSRLGGRLGLQIRLTVHGGLRVLEAIDSGTDVFSRPRLGIRDWAVIAVRALAGK
jgi:squalene synthase HpnC